MSNQKTIDDLVNAEIRYTQQPLEVKLAIATMSGDNYRACCKCKALLTEENKPIYFTLEQLAKLDPQGMSHGYCVPCLKVEYFNNFGREYEIKKPAQESETNEENKGRETYLLPESESV